MTTIEALGQMTDVFHIADTLAAVRQRAEEDTQLMRYMESNVATLHPAWINTCVPGTST